MDGLEVGVVRDIVLRLDSRAKVDGDRKFGAVLFDYDDVGVCRYDAETVDRLRKQFGLGDMFVTFLGCFLFVF